MILYRFWFLLFLFASVSYLKAQGWNQKEGEGYFQLREKTVTASDIFFQDEKVPVNGNILNSVTELYGEYGLSDKIMGILAVPLTYNSVSYNMNAAPGLAGVTDSKFGIGEINTGLGIGLITDKNLVLNLYLIAGIPVDSDETEYGVRLSDDEFTQNIRLGIGYGGFYPLYINGMIGFSNRTKNYSDAINYQMAMGYQLQDKWIFTFKVFGQNSLFNGSDSPFTGLMFGANNEEYFAYGPEIIYRMKKVGIFGNFMSGLAPYNVIATRSISLGVYYKMNDN